MATTQKGVNVLSWISQYDGIKSIAVQRSNDSIFNFTTIGYVKNIKKGTQAFIDGHPNPGTNWYRLYIVFSSDLTWFSNRVKLFVDSAQLMKQGVLPPNDSLQKIVTTLTLGDGTIPDPSEINAYTYIRSQYVFTNPFTGHINVELPDSNDKKSAFSLVFFDDKNRQVLEVPKIAEQNVIIDKRNFQRKGIYKFEMKKNQSLLETGYITIY
ncbi:MAG TPA: hypothetical protein PL009_05105 [Flavipsychrobacter sp.]|nr:hypothetical protein [Flavipsychrobacter sp.]